MHDAALKINMEEQTGLEPRFQQPPTWRWHQFQRNGRTLRFGSAFPQGTVPDAIVICLPGLSEFAEKYFEVANYCLGRNLGFWIFDWAGQGKSSRYFENDPHKRHSDGFDEDVEDLYKFFTDYVKYASVHPDKGRIAPVMLAHSMGANIGMHFLHKYPDIFEAAAFTAPMFGLKATQNIPAPIDTLASGLLSFFSGKKYAPGGDDWSFETRTNPNFHVFSSDPSRSAIHNYWCKVDLELQCGFVTHKWVHEAIKSCNAIQNKSLLRDIHTNCLFATAGIEEFVQNKAIHKVAAYLDNVKLLDYPESRHEILMERDEIRNDFLEHFYKQVKECVIDRPETLKPF
tara:strand:- start:2089 stop:3117 length:1029 start_codon:yes stop_codon:yes gene_type:complete